MKEKNRAVSELQKLLNSVEKQKNGMRLKFWQNVHTFGPQICNKFLIVFWSFWDDFKTARSPTGCRNWSEVTSRFFEDTKFSVSNFEASKLKTFLIPLLIQNVAKTGQCNLLFPLVCNERFMKFTCNPGLTVGYADHF